MEESIAKCAAGGGRMRPCDVAIEIGGFGSPEIEPWKIGINKNGRYLQSIGSCCMAIDDVNVGYL